jgi:type II secretory pathway component PulF
MYFFYYQILNSKGTTKRGILQLPFDNDISVAVYLERRGDIVLYVKAFPIIINWLFAFLAWIFRQPISRQELAESLNNIAVMLKGGIPIIQTLQDILSEHTNKTIRKIGQDMVMRIESGSSFTVAAESHRRIFSDPVMFLFRIGEASGNLDRTILEASKHILNLDRIRKDAKQALIYPIFMFVAVLSALLFWITFVTPIMLEVYDDLKVDLPPLTTSIIATSDFIIRNMKTLIFSTVFTILGIF